MKAEDWMTRVVCACRPDTGLDDASYFMWQCDCGCLPVVDAEERVVGMLTDRDVCMAGYTEGRALSELRAKDCMARDVWSCRPSDPLVRVVRRMRDHRVRRLPVVDGDGRLAGLISISDIARRAMDVREPKSSASLEAAVLAALARISDRHRHRHDPLWCAPERSKREVSKKGDGE